MASEIYTPPLLTAETITTLTERAKVLGWALDNLRVALAYTAGGIPAETEAAQASATILHLATQLTDTLDPDGLVCPAVLQWVNGRLVRSPLRSEGEPWAAGVTR